MTIADSKEREIKFLESGYRMNGKGKAKARQLASFQFAAQSGSVRAIRKALAAGISPDEPLGEETALGIATERGQVEIVRLLLKAGANPNRLSSGFPPIFRAAIYGYAAILKLLLLGGAELKSKRFGPVLNYACLEGHADVVKVLVSAGADVNLSYTMKDITGVAPKMTPLMVACMAGRIEVVKLLLHSGARVDFKDGKGHTSIYWARRNCGEIGKAITNLLTRPSSSQ